MRQPTSRRPRVLHEVRRCGEEGTGIGGGSSVVIGDGKDDDQSAHWVDLVWNGTADDTGVTRGKQSTA